MNSNIRNIFRLSDLLVAITALVIDAAIVPVSIAVALIVGLPAEEPVSATFGTLFITAKILWLANIIFTIVQIIRCKKRGIKFRLPAKILLWIYFGGIVILMFFGI